MGIFSALFRRKELEPRHDVEPAIKQVVDGSTAALLKQAQEYGALVAEFNRRNDTWERPAI